MRRWIAAASLAVAVGCGSGAGGFAPSQLRADSSAVATSPIRHVLIVVQENRTYNDLFATYPGGGGTTRGKIAKDAACHIPADASIALRESDLVTARDLNHNYRGYVTARAGGAMNGFDEVPFGDGLPECRYPYQYTNPSQIRPYWDLAKQYALAARMFTTQGSSSFTAHQDLIAGGTVLASGDALVNDPSCSGATCVWGCDAPYGTHTSLVTRDDDFEPGKGPFPCLGYRTLRDLLDAKKVSWRYYVPPMCCTAFGKLMSAFDAIKAVRYGSEWKTNVVTQKTIFDDLRDGGLPSVAWLIPEESESDHPGNKSDTGPSWVASVVNAVGESTYWNTTAVVVLWDDWGGLYDNLNPRQLGYGGLGFRVPALVISPYAKRGYVSLTQYEFGSILKYVEQNWQLGSLHTSDERATSIVDCFDYSQAPRKFVPISSKYSKAYFLRKPPSYLPVDTDM